MDGEALQEWKFQGWNREKLPLEPRTPRKHCRGVGWPKGTDRDQEAGSMVRGRSGRGEAEKRDAEKKC